MDEVWELEDTEHELFRDNTVKAVLVVADKKRIVATASLQVHSNAPDSAQLRWVATESDYRRQGLAMALVISLLEIARKEGCKETYLKTTTDLLGAISLYLQLGFEPTLGDAEDREIWKEVFDLLPDAKS